MDRCALLGAAALGGVVGLTIGGAYLAGGMARAAVVHSQIARLADVAEKGFSDAALTKSQSDDPGALAIARRLDPYNAAEFDPRNRSLALASRLESTAAASSLMTASLGKPPRSAASERINVSSPIRRVRGALDESRDLHCLTEAVYYEARGETAAGQAAVAQVVMNRAHNPAFPKSICGVVFQGSKTSGCQFSFACDGSTGRRIEPWAWRRAEKIAARSLDGYVMPEVGSATHFHVASISPDWKGRLMKVAQVGAHVFYRFGRNARPAPFTAEAPEAPAVEKTELKPIYASLSLAPVANVVATSAANAVTAGAGLVMAAASGIKPIAPPEAAKPDLVKAAPSPALAVTPVHEPASAAAPMITAPTTKPLAALDTAKESGAS